MKRIGKWLLVWTATSVVFCAGWALLRRMSAPLSAPEVTLRHPHTGYLVGNGVWP